MVGTALNGILVVLDGLHLLQPSLVESFTLGLFLTLLPIRLTEFVIGLDYIALTDFQDVLSLLLSLLNFLPSLLKTIKLLDKQPFSYLLLLSLEKGNTVSQDLNVFGGLLARDSLIGKGSGN
jgi:hypothetical protein